MRSLSEATPARGFWDMVQNTVDSNKNEGRSKVNEIDPSVCLFFCLDLESQFRWRK